MALDNIPTASTAGQAAGPSDKVRAFSSVAEATLALGCKTYTGTIAQGGGDIPTARSAK
ncbi:hypothetical protein [Micromonospora sp. KC721]|uniref:hypothetical protein n=1 Tax=Micromonospora sp. KC721 TaxID=2530380 RepID=UPI0014045E44|nr:hypothetical protein [Micromonospora sp. KC721]